ncbi:uncharacterized protein LOC127150565 [Cucumis melo]|uniref:Uncharacterized protein LOC127150565 n=1 Tax=Cucumis melo TaxID=3656 RepID=A0ABM3L2Y1_CUCME|nr:uncharacterized protein LOC127150565 [Cucumis melo]
MTQPSEDEPEVTILSPPVRQVKVRERRFKSTPPRRSYRLPSEKSQEEASSKLYESVLSESVPVVDLDSNDPDDVPLARLLKRTLIPYVSDKLPVDPPNSIHSQESSSTEGVFIATPSIPLASDVQSGPSAHSPPASPPPFATVDAHESVPNDVPEVPPNDNENPAVPSTSADIPTASKLAERKFQQKRCNITTKTGRKKIPPNIPFVLIDGISFHHEESVQCWKFVVLQGIADEVNVSDKHQSCMSIMDLIGRVGLTKTISNVGPFYPQLIRKFIVNLPNDFNDPSSLDYQTVHIRGFKFVISPIVINGFLGNVIDVDCSPSSPSTDVLASVLSDGTLSTWPVKMEFLQSLLA